MSTQYDEAQHLDRAVLEKIRTVLKPRWNWRCLFRGHNWGGFMLSTGAPGVTRFCTRCHKVRRAG